jgi:hypothetical protein
MEKPWDRKSEQPELKKKTFSTFKTKPTTMDSRPMLYPCEHSHPTLLTPKPIPIPVAVAATAASPGASFPVAPQRNAAAYRGSSYVIMSPLTSLREISE